MGPPGPSPAETAAFRDSDRDVRRLPNSKSASGGKVRSGRKKDPKTFPSPSLGLVDPPLLLIEANPGTVVETPEHLHPPAATAVLDTAMNYFYKHERGHGETLATLLFPDHRFAATPPEVTGQNSGKRAASTWDSCDPLPRRAV